MGTLVPRLATAWQWLDDRILEVKLRQGVTFHNGAMLDPADVVTTYAAQWDAQHVLHVGRTGDFSYFRVLWGDFLRRK